MTLDWTSVLVGATVPCSLALLPMVGKSIGAWFSVRANTSASPADAPNKVVITGGTKGLGNALAEKFLQLGDDVTICSRTPEDCMAEQARLQAAFPNRVVRGFAADVGSADSVEALADFAVKEMGRIDIWVNNAAVNQGPRAPVTEVDGDKIGTIITSTLTSAILGSRAAITRMQDQPAGGKVFLVDGAGSRGEAQPNGVPYAAAKAAIPQLTKSLAGSVKGTKVSIHCVSPGMVNTDLLRGAAGENNYKVAKILNILAESPENVADWMVPRMRGVKGNGQYFKFLTPAGGVYRLLTYSSRKNRFLPESAQATVQEGSKKSN